jgi:hypothetical protein
MNLFIIIPLVFIAGIVCSWCILTKKKWYSEDKLVSLLLEARGYKGTIFVERIVDPYPTYHFVEGSFCLNGKEYKFRKESHYLIIKSVLEAQGILLSQNTISKYFI